jgi:hypothetical protein
VGGESTRHAHASAVTGSRSQPGVGPTFCGLYDAATDAPRPGRAGTGRYPGRRCAPRRDPRLERSLAGRRPHL